MRDEEGNGVSFCDNLNFERAEMLNYSVVSLIGKWFGTLVWEFILFPFFHSTRALVGFVFMVMTSGF